METAKSITFKIQLLSETLKLYYIHGKSSSRAMLVIPTPHTHYC